MSEDARANQGSVDREAENRKALLVNEIVARCWADPEFFVELVTDPLRVLRAYELPIAPGVSVTVAIDTPEHCTFVIPLKPRDYSPGYRPEIGPSVMCRLSIPAPSE